MVTVSYLSLYQCLLFPFSYIEIKSVSFYWVHCLCCLSFFISILIFRSSIIIPWWFLFDNFKSSHWWWFLFIRGTNNNQLKCIKKNLRAYTYAENQFFDHHFLMTRNWKKLYIECAFIEKGLSIYIWPNDHYCLPWPLLAKEG